MAAEAAVRGALVREGTLLAVFRAWGRGVVRLRRAGLRGHPLHATPQKLEHAEAQRGLEIVLLKQALAKSDPPPSPASRKEMEQALKLLCTQARQIIGGEGFGLAA